MTTAMEEIHRTLDLVISSPYAHDVLDLSVAIASIPREEMRNPAWMIIVGAPGCGKTSTVLNLVGLPQVEYRSEISAASFASAHDDRNPEQDLLHIINGKCLIVKEMASFFAGDYRDNHKLISRMTDIYDGNFQRSVGGKKGTVGSDSLFTFIGCSTPETLENHTKWMNQIGPRFLFFRMGGLNRALRHQGYAMSWKRREKREKTKELKQLIRDHMNTVVQREFPEDIETPKQRVFLMTLAEIVSAGRTSPTAEDVAVGVRTLEQLMVIGRALARLYGRDHLTVQDLRVLRTVAVDSLDRATRALVNALIDKPDGLTVAQLVKLNPCGNTWVRDTLSVFTREAVGLVVSEKKPTQTKPATIYRFDAGVLDVLADPLEPGKSIYDNDLTRGEFSTVLTHNPSIEEETVCVKEVENFNDHKPIENQQHTDGEEGIITSEPPTEDYSDLVAL